MKIAFDITSDEADIIAEQYAYNPDRNGDKEAFVLELFKQFGRTCIESKAIQIALGNEKIEIKAAIDAARADISF